MDAFLKVKEHFEGQDFSRDELKSYMEEVNIELMVDIDIDDDLVNYVFNELKK